MKISRMSDENILSIWASEKQNEDAKIKLIANDIISQMPEEVGEENLTVEREKIETHASNKTKYLYSSNWSKSVIASIKEYAAICGTEIEAIDLNNYSIQKVASSSQMTRTASKTETVLKLNDPFHLENIEQKQERSDWQTITAEKKLVGNPSMMTNSVRAIGGGEDYFKNSDVPLAQNQNSILNPNAIKEFAESKVEGIGEKLARSVKEREEFKQKESASREQDMASKMKLDTLIRGSVFPTGIMNLQAGSASSNITLDKSNLPKETVGEKIAAVNDKRKSDRHNQRGEFSISKEAKVGIGDSLFNSLKKTMGK